MIPETAKLKFEQMNLSATDQVFQTLYSQIISVELAPDTKVSEAEIAKQFGVSRQPVRDAFFKLSDLGFISIMPQRGTLVNPISKKAVLDAIFVRTALEVECLRVAVTKVTDEQLQVLRDNLQEQNQAKNEDDQARFYELDESFHAQICEIAEQSHVWRLIQAQKAHMDRIRYLSLSMATRYVVVDEHSAVLQALADRNSAKAEENLRIHLSSLRPQLGQIEQKFPHYFENKD